MSRTVIGLSQGAGRNVRATLERAPVVYDYASVDLDPTTVTGTDLLQRGQALGTLLCHQDPLRSVLGTALSQPPDTEPAPLYFHVRSATADAIPWEQVYLPPVGFCALDQRWPVGRIADRVSTVRGRPFQPPLRVVAVLSAAGRDGGPQLTALRRAVAEAAVPTTLHVISGDEDVVAAMTEENESAELIAGTSPGLCRQLAEAEPHVVHLLCHGQKLAKVPVLTFASVGDVDAAQADLGSVNVTVTELTRALSHSDPWLVVLAACQTADAEDPDGRPFAHELVHQGLTAAIGMRRLVDLKDTDRFCRQLYPEVLAAVAAAVTTPGRGEQIIDWAQVLTAPRRVLSDPDPATVEAWLDPVLYVQSEDLRVLPEVGTQAHEHARVQGRLDQFRGLLRSEDLDPAVREWLIGEIAQMEATLAGRDTEQPRGQDASPVAGG
ncbi:CHAT domain-containing protein [Ornithinicoccus halotolerans]|uniref:CHAT domain-containing protein n=1 Tax=Ornithinicoccus halotolerans TaxID=1748220 RepID=UPI001885D142|nr:CHAT domain-containing protein [Ornithinicoccus halotolerans]